MVGKKTKKKFPLRLDNWAWEEIELLKYTHPGSSYNDIICKLIEYGLNDDHIMSKVKSTLPRERENICILRKYY